MENLYTPNCIRTRSGQYLDVFNPDPEKILIEDIAWALSNIPRFGGHLSVFYSVASHSLSVFDIVCIQSPEDTKENNMLLRGALLHDASEAYLMDLPSPIKNRMPEYQTVEANLMNVIADKFNFVGFDKHPLVKAADKAALEDEWNQFMLETAEKRMLFTADFTAECFLSIYRQICI